MVLKLHHRLCPKVPCRSVKRRPTRMSRGRTDMTLGEGQVNSKSCVCMILAQYFRADQELHLRADPNRCTATFACTRLHVASEQKPHRKSQRECPARQPT